MSLAWTVGLLLAAADAPPIPAASRQLIVVVTPNETATMGVLHRFERDTEASPWKELAPEVQVVVGEKGLASGAGLLRDSVPGLPSKTEGDGKSPAGVFSLTSAFGFGKSGAGLRIPYVPVTETLECVDDPRSSYYNRLVERSAVPRPDWKSSEKMREIQGYRWGVVVAHNAEPVVPGAGSCIFLHAWSSPASPTAGCTAMPEERILEVIRWLDSKSKPVLVQLTENAHASLRGPWHLPD